MNFSRGGYRCSHNRRLLNHKVLICLQDINIEVVAILNDAVGTLMTGAYEDRACGIGLILGMIPGYASCTFRLC